MKKYTNDELFDTYIGEIEDYLPTEYTEEIKNSQQYKDFVKELDRQEQKHLNKILEDNKYE